MVLYYLYFRDGATRIVQYDEGANKGDFVRDKGALNGRRVSTLLDNQYGDQRSLVRTSRDDIRYVVFSDMRAFEEGSKHVLLNDSRPSICFVFNREFCINFRCRFVNSIIYVHITFMWSCNVPLTRVE